MLRGILLFLHVFGLALWFGVTFALALLTVRANKTDDRAVIAFTYRASSQLLKGPALVGMLLTIVAGFGLSGVGGYGFFELSPHWLFQMQVLGLAAFFLAIAIQIPNAGRLARAAEAAANAGEESAAFTRFRRTNALVSSINGLLLILITLLGTLRPF
ncbi:MAG: DUF2269 family protein [Gemmatimonadetes bacterium]|nr:DUF2269 family protein [Gemmatimonadota bacterium]